MHNEFHKETYRFQEVASLHRSLPTRQVRDTNSSDEADVDKDRIGKSGMRGGERARGVDEVREKKDSRNSIINNLGKIIKF
jgi:hypothetical protein